MEKHKCNCSELISQMFSAPMKMPHINKLGKNYVIFDPTFTVVEDDMEITIIGVNGTWKIMAAIKIHDKLKC